MEEISISLLRRLGVLLVLTTVTATVFALGGCQMAPAQSTLGLAKIEISGYGAVEAPDGVEVMHRSGPPSENSIENTIVLPPCGRAGFAGLFCHSCLAG